MFKKLREKLKQSLSIFSRKAEEVAEPIEESTEEFKGEPAVEGNNETKEEITQADVKRIREKETKPSESNASKHQHSASAEVNDQPAPNNEHKGETVPTTPLQENKPLTEVLQSPDTKNFALKTPKAPKPESKPSLFKRIFKKDEDDTATQVQVPKTSSVPNEASIFAKTKHALTTRKLSAEKFDQLFWDLELGLLENNVAIDVITKLKEDLKLKLMGKPLPRNLESVVEQSLNESLKNIVSIEQINILTKAKEKKPLIMAFFGINGSGKTTTIAKIASLLKQEGLSCVFAAADTFRAAAIQQLEEHATKLNTKIIKHDYGADAAAVAFDAVRFAKKNNIDVVLIDTAGRLHSDVNLMDELKKIVRVAKPDLNIFVGESITGNDCIEQSQKFNEHVKIDAIILTKADVDEKGGTALSISYVTKKPILYIGTGQMYQDLKPFTKEFILKNLGLDS
jgi:fused signal recognition particle receptor